ncbi:hypothetical protein M433DRAFT_144931 [Acidomyces richmondensis BFW]|nr:hypothetical protein M433DRAFT_144931 [Acidomyces richmondensis BFW]
MGNTTSSSTAKHRGKINGRDVIFTYRPPTVEDDGELIWIYDNNGASPPKHIPATSIIAAVPVHPALPSDHCLLYTLPNSTSTPQSSPVLLHTAIATHLPPAFISAHIPPPNAWWQTSSPQQQFPNLHVVVSPTSGTGQAPEVWKHLVRPLLHHFKADYTLHTTTSPASLADLANSHFLPNAYAGKQQLILLLSGDGGVIDLLNANALPHHDNSHSYVPPTIALLPVGTGNALANSAKIASDATLGLRTLLHGTRHSLPIFRATFSAGAREIVDEGRGERELPLLPPNGAGLARGFHGAVVCSWALHASLVADSDTAAYRKFGAARFRMAGEEALFPSDGKGPHEYRGKLSVLRPSPSSSTGKEEWHVIPRRSHGYVLATLCRCLERGFTISPSSRPLDGKMWLVHFGAVSGEEAMRIMKAAYEGGRHIKEEGVGYEEVEGIRIDVQEEGEEGGRWRRVCVDGRIVRIEEGGWVEVRRAKGGVKGEWGILCCS